jgi:hypothetical protein
LAKVDNETIERIRELRERGFIYEDIAEIVGCNVKTVGHYAKGIHPKTKPKRHIKTRAKAENKNDAFLSPLENLAPVIQGRKGKGKGIGGFLDTIVDTVTSNPQASFGVGVESGADTITILKSGLRIWDGDADWDDYWNFSFNLAGFIGGIAGGRQAFDKKYGYRDRQRKKEEVITLDDGTEDRNDGDRIDAYIITAYLGGKTPLDVVSKGICSMERAKKLWHDYKEFSKNGTVETPGEIIEEGENEEVDNSKKNEEIS